MTDNANLAGAVLGRLAGLGVEDLVVCAGARNVPLVSSLLARLVDHELRVFHHFDERAAAFFGLGLAKRALRPVAVLTTSGTAAAELLPAVVEAFYSGVPLILVTADRPSSYRGSGAPQAIEQAGIFGPYAVAIDVSRPQDLEATLDWRGDAPLHLNVCLEEPRREDRNETWTPDCSRSAEATGRANVSSVDPFLEDREGLLVILGELEASWRDEVERFLVSLGCPIWAEATSGLRESAALAGRILIGEPSLPNKVLRLGGVPSLRLWRDLEVNEGIPVLSICRRPFSGLARPSGLIVTDCFPRLSATTQEGRVADRTLLDEAVFAAHPRSEPSVVRELSRRIPPEALVYLGNSLPIREWNLAAVLDVPHPGCFASRGANGIDGQIATYLGLSVGGEESWGIFGDLTALYDLNAPALLGQLAPGRRRIVVINNGGGRIFSRLPSMAGLSGAEKLVTENRHELRFEAWAAMWGMDYRRWPAGEPFPVDLSDAVVIEAVPDEAETEAFWAARP